MYQYYFSIMAIALSFSLMGMKEGAKPKDISKPGIVVTECSTPEKTFLLFEFCAKRIDVLFPGAKEDEGLRFLQYAMTIKDLPKLIALIDGKVVGFMAYETNPSKDFARVGDDSGKKRVINIQQVGFLKEHPHSYDVLFEKFLEKHESSCDVIRTAVHKNDEALTDSCKKTCDNSYPIRECVLYKSLPENVKKMIRLQD